MLTTILIDEHGEGRISAAELKALGVLPLSRVKAEITVKEIAPPSPAMIPPNKTLQNILDDYEAQYAMSSEECARRLENDEIDETTELLRWMGFYELARRAVGRGDNPKNMKFTLTANVSQTRGDNHVQQL